MVDLDFTPNKTVRSIANIFYKSYSEKPIIEGNASYLFLPVPGPDPFMLGEDALRNIRKLVSGSKKPSKNYHLDKEYWIKYYLKHNGLKYGIHVKDDLDKKEYQMKFRGDLLVEYKKRKLVLEIETDLKNFIKHGHSTCGKKGW